MAYYFESWSILQDNLFNHKTVISVRVDDLVNLGFTRQYYIYIFDNLDQFNCCL